MTQAPVQPTTPTTPVTLPVERTMEVLVAAGGNIKLAAERLSKELVTPVHPADIVHVLQSSEDETLARVIRNGLMLQVFETLGDVRMQVAASLGEMAPGEVARLYSSLLDSASNLVKPAQKAGDTNIAILGTPEALEAARAQLADRIIPRRIAGPNGRSLEDNFPDDPVEGVQESSFVGTADSIGDTAA